jgi:Cdc6-like AAA superfamily ATPase
MKIIKTKRLVEEVEDEVLTDVSTAEIADDIQDGAEEADKFVEEDDAEEEAEVVKNIAKIIKNPYGTGRLSDVEKVLQRALNNAIESIEDGTTEMGAFPNVLIYGLAGFGKTAKVKAFCRQHNLNIFECDAKSLDIATVGGIPYPKTDPKTGEITQSPIGSRYWDGLNKPNTVLYLDELNRTGPSIRGSLLTLINEHTLPMTIEDPKTGEIKNVKH